jgi:hypothetical protein
MSNNFTFQVNRLTDKARAAMNFVVRETILDLSLAVVNRSPVGDPALWSRPATAGYVGGKFRGNWQYSENTAPTGTLPTIDSTYGTSNASYARISSKLASSVIGKVHYVVNNLPYSRKLEYGWSTQAPTGVVGVTIAEFNSRVRGIVARVH